MKVRVVAIIVILLIGVVAAGEYYASTFSSGSSKDVSFNIQITGGVGGATVDRPYPNNATVKVGQDVTLAFLNTDDNTHGYVMPALGIDTGKIPAGHTYRATFIVNQTGTFVFTQPPDYCSAGFGNACNSVQDLNFTLTVNP